MGEAVLDVEETLIKARGTGQILKIAYDGGGQPGAVREILIQRLDRDRVQAFCLAEHKLKTFLLERIIIAGDDEPVTYVASLGHDEYQTETLPKSFQPDMFANNGSPPLSASRLKTWIYRLLLVYGFLSLAVHAGRWAGLFKPWR